MRNFGRLKKAAAVMAVAAVCVSMNIGTVANAETLDDVETNSADVTATYESSETEIVYSVDITWGSLEFTYTEAGAQTWDPSTHTYSEAEEGGWSYEEGSNILTITNHSNSAVGGTVKCETDETYAETITLSMDADNAVYEDSNHFSVINSADPVTWVGYFLSDASDFALENPDGADYVEIPFELSGDPDEFEGSVTVGTVTVKLLSATGHTSWGSFFSQNYSSL
ncbi:MAG: hypothetical protein LUE29_14135 [Lachnospiraceae bacterium]|nr:hypothetical protein [Lachnospiraceae bacterium]